MNPEPFRKLLIPAFALATLLLLNTLHAQSPPAGDDEVVELSPFEVQADEGYVATNSMAGSRLNRPLAEIPSSLSVMTSAVLEDLGASDVVEALEYDSTARAYTAAEEQPGGGIQSNIFSPATVQMRGFPSNITRNYFQWEIFSDSYNADRLELSRGPNSILFSTGGVGGIVNVSTKRAITGDSSANFVETAFQVGSWDRYRATLDVNHAFSESLALRVNAVWHDEDNWVEFQNDHREGLTGALTWRPFNSERFGLDVRLEAETLERQFQNGREIPMREQVLGGWDGTGVELGQDPLEIDGLTVMGSSNSYVWIPETGTFMNFAREGITEGDGDIEHFLDPEIAPRSTNFRSGEGTWIDVQNYTAMVQGRVGQSFFAEFAFNRQDQFFENLELRMTDLYRDPNRFLPDGSSNPKFGQYFSQTIGGQLLNRPGDTTTDEVRATASYNLKLGEITGWHFLGDHWFAGLVSKRESKDWSHSFKYYAFDDAGNRLSRVLVRRYIDDPGAGEIRGGIDGTTISGSGINGRWIYERARDRDYDETLLESKQIVYQGSFWNRRIALTYGLRWDDLKDRELPDSEKQISADYRSVTFTSFDLSDYDIAFDGNKAESYGFVIRPIDLVAFTYNYSESFAPEGRRRWDVTDPDPWNNLATKPIGPETGGTEDIGVRFFLKEGDIQASMVWFETDLNNQFTNVNSIQRGPGRTALRIIRGDPSFDLNVPFTQGSQGSLSEGVEIEVTANVTDHFRLRGSFSKTTSTLNHKGREVIGAALEGANYVERWTGYANGWQLGEGETLPEGVMEPSNPVTVPQLGRPLTLFEAHGDGIDPTYTLTRAEPGERPDPTGEQGVHDAVNDLLWRMDDRIFSRINLPPLESRTFRGSILAAYSFHDTGTRLDNLSVRYAARFGDGFILGSEFDEAGNPVILQDDGIFWTSDIGFRYKMKFERFDLKLDLFIKNVFDDNLIERTRTTGKYTYNDERNFLFTATARF